MRLPRQPEPPKQAVACLSATLALAPQNAPFVMVTPLDVPSPSTLCQGLLLAFSGRGPPPTAPLLAAGWRPAGGACQAAGWSLQEACSLWRGVRSRGRCRGSHGAPHPSSGHLPVSCPGRRRLCAEKGERAGLCCVPTLALLKITR